MSQKRRNKENGLVSFFQIDQTTLYSGFRGRMTDNERMIVRVRIGVTVNTGKRTYSIIKTHLTSGSDAIPFSRRVIHEDTHAGWCFSEMPIMYPFKSIHFVTFFFDKRLVCALKLFLYYALWSR